MVKTTEGIMTEGSVTGVGVTGKVKAQEAASESEGVCIVTETVNKKFLTFGVRENPPFHISFIYAIQIVMSHIHGPLSASFVVHHAVCGGTNRLLLAHIFATSCFLTGLCTIIQVTFGLRLPVTQVSSSAFLPPIIALMSTTKCPDESLPGTNGTTNSPGLDEPWGPRIQEISGGLIMASLVEVALGMLGLVGLLMRFIGPLTIGACVSLVSISLVDPAIKAAKVQWGIAAMTVAVAIICSQVLGHVTIPVPTWDRKSGVTTRRYPLVKMFAHLFAYGLPWLLCCVLTLTNVFPNDPEHPNYKARTDAKTDTIQDMQWFFVPYPGQWGAPRFGAAIFVGMFSATISSMLESVGDYYATARVCEEPDPPRHAVNRGIAVEGIGGVLSGVFGLGYNTTSYSNCVGMITYTGVASRVAWYITGVMFIILAVVGKFAAALATVPEPILGGSMTLSLAMVLMVGLSNLQFVKINSVRNQTVFGLSLLVGMMLPRFMQENPGAINTGSSDLDQAIKVILQSGPCIGGILAAILDNLLPGTREERGMIDHHSTKKVGRHDDASSPEDQEDLSIYDLPFLSRKYLRKFKILSYIPFLPSYDENVYNCSCGRKKQSNNTSGDQKFHHSPSTTCLVEEGISDHCSTKF